MPIRAFISYSHLDEKYLDKLHKHMSILRREGSIETWVDRQILPGEKLDSTVSESILDCNLFVALVSPDYLSSNYCYEREFEEALRMAQDGSIQIIPVIVEPCDWLSSPFREFLALPKDGKPISEWANANVAYLDVVSGIRRLVASNNDDDLSDGTRRSTGFTRGRQIKIKQEFDSIQKGDFIDQSFDTIRNYFRDSCKELSGIEDLKAKFDNMSDSSFTCTVVNRGVKGGREAHITVRHKKGSIRFFGDIDYVFEAHASANTSSGSISVAADDYNMYLKMGYSSFSSDSDAKYDALQAAEELWLKFIEQAGIDYD